MKFICCGNKGSMPVNDNGIPMDTKKETEAGEPKYGLGVRHWQTFLYFFALTVAYAQRVNLSVAVVAMTDAAAANINFPEYDWPEKTKSLLLSSFFWGYVITQVPSGQLARKFGGKITLLTGLSICSVLNILTPLFADWGGWQLVCALRVVEGLCQGVVFPSIHTLISTWVPPNERPVLGTCAYTGNQFGTIVMLATSGLLASSSAGWPSIFYISGGVGCVWSVFFFIWGASSPAEYKRISPEERKMIELAQASESTSEHPKEKLHTPWLSFFTSPAFLALIIAHSANNWGFWTLLTEIPSYMKNVLGKDIKSNALLSALPYFAMFCMSFVFSAIATLLNKRNCISTVVSRKLFNSLGLWVPMCALIGLAYVDADQSNLAVILLTVTVGFNGACYLGFQINHIDLSPNFAGILMGITNCVGNIMSIIAPLLVGFIVTNEQDVEQWRIVFFIAAAIYLVGNGLFIIFGRASVQPWNDPPAKHRRNSTPQVESQH
ncbi:putative inorganic phosphate cotransporter isoform X1 [Drosophila nasuta]|uniref:Putative inorganic phosphate cotransporter n=1 Tax=Drosophila albomicans TaxID=7291 RepID=A0A6P8X0F4_DROAB|nr:putative inorganic phosphate cotransporter isoform X1 [Drosophila albomicans]XP_060654352.1 putative inorganic phosphate cotransporter isoform X1 [Drosophila nasuta]